VSGWSDDPRDELKVIKISMPASMREELLHRARRSVTTPDLTDTQILSEYLRRAVSLQRFVEDHEDGVSLQDITLRSEPRDAPGLTVDPTGPLDLGDRAKVRLWITTALEELREGRYLDAQDTLIAAHQRLTPDA
jgi:hypothetical protein